MIPGPWRWPRRPGEGKRRTAELLEAAERDQETVAADLERVKRVLAAQVERLRRHAAEEGE